LYRNGTIVPPSTNQKGGAVPFLYTLDAVYTMPGLGRGAYYAWYAMLSTTWKAELQFPKRVRPALFICAGKSPQTGSRTIKQVKLYVRQASVYYCQ
jgi:hypothetical protein